MTRYTALCFFVAVATMVLTATTANARSFQCDKVYANLSSLDNDIQKCFTDGSHMQTVALSDDHLPHVVYAVLPLVCLIVALLCCPTVCCFRYVCNCCCGGRSRRPDGCCRGSDEWLEKPDEVVNAAYPRSSVRNTKACAVIVFTLGLGMMLLAIVGTTIVNSSYTRLFDETKGLLSWVDRQSLLIKEVLTINETKTLIPPLEESFFTDISVKINDLRKTIDDTKKSGDPYMEYVVIAGLVIGIIPLLFLFLTVIAAVCDCRGCILVCNICCHCIWILPYTIISFVFLILAWFLGTFCDERDLFLSNTTAPGLIKLGAVPLCIKTFPFESTKDTVPNLIREQAIAACTAMTNICDPHDVYHPTNGSAKVYNCRSLTNATTDCRTFITANTIANSFTLKPTPLVHCRRNESDPTTDISPCNISTCAQYCNVAEAKNFSKTIVTNLKYASNGEIAYTAYVEPLLDCGVIYKQALQPLVVCGAFTTSLQLLGGSFFGYSFLFLVGMVVIWRGEKRFFKPAPREGESDNSDLEVESKKGDDFNNLSVESTKKSEPYE